MSKYRSATEPENSSEKRKRSKWWSSDERHCVIWVDSADARMAWKDEERRCMSLGRLYTALSTPRLVTANASGASTKRVGTDTLALADFMPLTSLLP
jgi:hypothetical protein